MLWKEEKECDERRWKNGMKGGLWMLYERRIRMILKENREFDERKLRMLWKEVKEYDGRWIEKEFE